LRLNRPERKNPLTSDSDAELRDLFRHLSNLAVVKTCEGARSPASRHSRLEANRGFFSRREGADF